jgi:hypothetical protein
MAAFRQPLILSSESWQQFAGSGAGAGTYDVLNEERGNEAAAGSLESEAPALTSLAIPCGIP